MRIFNDTLVMYRLTDYLKIIIQYEEIIFKRV